jgi:hypothetical protein
MADTPFRDEMVTPDSRFGHRMGEKCGKTAGRIESSGLFPAFADAGRNPAKRRQRILQCLP